MLAIAGLLPWAPHIEIESELALALFIAPALLDSAFDLPPRELRRHWRPLVAFAGLAVVITPAAVAWTAVEMVGMPIAAIALAAIVAPPDAAAAAAMHPREVGEFDALRRQNIAANCCRRKRACSSTSSSRASSARGWLGSSRRTSFALHAHA